jgi:hypothetical protein
MRLTWENNHSIRFPFGQLCSHFCNLSNRSHQSSFQESSVFRCLGSFRSFLRRNPLLLNNRHDPVCSVVRNQKMQRRRDSVLGCHLFNNFGCNFLLSSNGTECCTDKLISVHHEHAADFRTHAHAVSRDD